MIEPTLFDAVGHPTARATDPDTSHAAAKSMEAHVGDETRRVLAAIVALEFYGGHGATAHEIVMRLAYTGRAPQQNCVARRCTDLRDAGLIFDTEDRRTGGSGRSLIVWSATSAGREAVRS